MQHIKTKGILQHVLISLAQLQQHSAPIHHHLYQSAKTAVSSSPRLSIILTDSPAADGLLPLQGQLCEKAIQSNNIGEIKI